MRTCETDITSTILLCPYICEYVYACMHICGMLLGIIQLRKQEDRCHFVKTWLHDGLQVPLMKNDFWTLGKSESL